MQRFSPFIKSGTIKTGFKNRPQWPHDVDKSLYKKGGNVGTWETEIVEAGVSMWDETVGTDNMATMTTLRYEDQSADTQSPDTRDSEVSSAVHIGPR